MKIECARCYCALGEILSGSKLRKGIVYLCAKCNDQAKLAENMADLATSQTKDFMKTSGCEVVDELFGAMNKKVRL